LKFVPGLNFHAARFPLFLLSAFLAACILRIRPGRSFPRMARAVARTFFIFVLAGLAAAWLIFPLSH
jgi:hypothetical protein